MEVYKFKSEIKATFNIFNHYLTSIIYEIKELIVLLVIGGEGMGKIIKINLFAEVKRKDNKKIKLKTVEETIFQYNDWLKENNREDKIESYEKFLQAK